MYEINTFCDNGHFVPVCLIIRKIFENLVIDILRKKYGTVGIVLYYDRSKGRFQPKLRHLYNQKHAKDS